MAETDNDIPGTVQLLEGAHATTRDSQVVLIPTPSENINDPLKWSKGKKILVAANLLAWTFFANAAIAWTSPAWAIWTVDLNTTFTLLNYGQATLVLTCGVGCFFLQPWALKYGRRGPYICGAILILVGLIIGAFMKNINGFFAYMTLAGLGSAPSYAVIVTSLMDISYLHQKGRMLSLYGIVLIGGNFLPPVAAGYIVDSQGWRWCFYYLIIFFTISSLLVAFGAEETIFPRNCTGIAVGAATSSDDGSLEATRSHTKHSSDDVKADATADNNEWVRNGPEQMPAIIPTRRYNYLEQMTLFRRDPTVKASYLKLTFEVLELMALPAPVWASVMVALATFVVSLVFTTQASLFAAPPYNFSPAQLGLMYFALLIGNAIGSLYGGNLADWVVVRQARRNGGISESEHRLITYLPLPFIVAGGILLYGVGASEGLHWIVPCLGLVLIGIYLNSSLPICMGYALDSYPELSGETVQLSNFIRNVAGGAFSFCIQPWITHNGIRNTSIIMAVLVFVLNLSSIPLQLWGKSIRVRTTARYRRITQRTTYF